MSRPAATPPSPTTGAATLPPPAADALRVGGPTDAALHPSSKSGDVLLEVRDVTVRFGDATALDRIDLAVPRGTIIGLIGPSGCGKTTLVRTMLGITAPTAGVVRVFGHDPTAMTARDRARIAYMPQMPVLFPNLSVAGNLAFIASLYGVPRRVRRSRVRELLDLVDLSGDRDKLLAHCSGGMQRRVTLAATLVHDPELLFLDEPTAGVDPILRDRFWTYFRALRGAGKTIVVPTQYVGEAISCDHVAIMSEGSLVTVATPGELPRLAFRGEPHRLVLDAGWIPSSVIERIGEHDGVTSVRRMEDDLLVVLADGSRDAARLLATLQSEGLPVQSLEPVEPTFDQMFVELIEAHRTRMASVAEAATAGAS